MDRTPCEDCTIWTLIVSIDCGKYFAAFEYVIPGHVAKFPFFIALSHVDFTGNSAAACMYLTRGSKLGRPYALCADGFIRFVVVSIFSCPFVLRSKRYIFGRFFYLHPVKIFLPSGNITTASFFVNKTLQSASQIGPTPISVLVKEGIMYPVVGNSAANWGMGIVAVAADFTICLFAVPTVIGADFVSG